MSKQKTATKAAPQKDSLRSIRRANRGFKSLELSCRIHKRALRRSEFSRTQYGKVYPAGTKTDGGISGNFVHNAGGSLRYH